MLQELESIATRIVEGKEEDITEALPNLSIFRQRRESVFIGTVYHPLFCVILRGRKEFQINERTVSLTAGDAFVISHDMPIASKITDASHGSPYLATILSLDLRILRGLHDQVESAFAGNTDAKFLSTGSLHSEWADPMKRYLDLAAKPLKANVLGPLILKEIHFELLMSPMGGMLRNLLNVDSHASRVAAAIQHIRERFREPLVIAELAKVASMSTSSFHEHFKSVTGTTPRQYQKDLRLIEARELLMTGGSSVSSAGLDVGYESPSHFSRDYARKHGCSPKHHLAKARGRANRSR